MKTNFLAPLSSDCPQFHLYISQQLLFSLFVSLSSCSFCSSFNSLSPFLFLPFLSATLLFSFSPCLSRAVSHPLSFSFFPPSPLYLPLSLSLFQNKACFYKTKMGGFQLWQLFSLISFSPCIALFLSVSLSLIFVLSFFSSEAPSLASFCVLNDSHQLYSYPEKPKYLMSAPFVVFYLFPSTFSPFLLSLYHYHLSLFLCQLCLIPPWAEAFTHQEDVCADSSKNETLWPETNVSGISPNKMTCFSDRHILNSIAPVSACLHHPFLFGMLKVSGISPNKMVCWVLSYQNSTSQSWSFWCVEVGNWNWQTLHARMFQVFVHTTNCHFKFSNKWSREQSGGWWILIGFSIQDRREVPSFWGCCSSLTLGIAGRDVSSRGAGKNWWKEQKIQILSPYKSIKTTLARSCLKNWEKRAEKIVALSQFGQVTQLFMSRTNPSVGQSGIALLFTL